MLILAKLIGIVIVVMGIIFLLVPKTIKRVIAFWLEGKKIYIGGVIRILIGIILLMAASECRLTGIVVTLGILSLIKGILIFIIGPEKVKSMLKWWQGKSNLVLRLVALLAIAIGALLIYSI